VRACLNHAVELEERGLELDAVARETRERATSRRSGTELWAKLPRHDRVAATELGGLAATPEAWRRMHRGDA
jgi:hypothetical protein